MEDIIARNSYVQKDVWKFTLDLYLHTSKSMKSMKSESNECKKKEILCQTFEELKEKKIGTFFEPEKIPSILPLSENNLFQKVSIKMLYSKGLLANRKGYTILYLYGKPISPKIVEEVLNVSIAQIKFDPETAEKYLGTRYVFNFLVHLYDGSIVVYPPNIQDAAKKFDKKRLEEYRELIEEYTLERSEIGVEDRIILGYMLGYTPRKFYKYRDDLPKALANYIEKDIKNIKKRIKRIY